MTQRHSRPTRLRAVYTALAAIVLVTLVAGTALAGSPAGVTPPSLAAADTPRDPLVVQRELLAACQVDLQSATTRAQRDTARACIATKERSIAWLLAHPSPSPTATVGPTTPAPTLPPTSAPPTTVAPTPSPTSSPTPSPTPTSDPGCTGQANEACTGVPVGWHPTETIFGDWNITIPGTYSGRRVYGDIQVKVDNVTIQQTEVIGGLINNRDVRCHNGLVLDQVSIIQSVPFNSGGSVGMVGPGGYTMRRGKILDRTEGWRVGGKTDGGCGPVVIEDSFARIVPPQPCPLDSEGNSDWHGDGIQGYDGPPVKVTNVTIDFNEVGCGGTAAFYYVGGTSGNTSVDINGLTVKGGGFPFRLGTPGAVRNVHVVDGSWHWGPTDITVACSQLVPYQVDVVRIDADWQTTAVVRTLPC